MGSYTVHIVGVDPCRKAPFEESLFEGCALVVLTERFWRFLPQSIAANPDIELCTIAPLAESLPKIEQCSSKGHVIVLASGDPLFFGIGKKIIEYMGEASIEIHPAVSSIQHCFAQFGLSWGNAHFVSLHGRTHDNPVGLLLEHPLCAVLTDKANSPDRLARELAEFFQGTDKQPILYVAENIGNENQRLLSGSPEEIAQTQFSGLSCLVVQRDDHKENVYPFHLGLTEDDIVHSRGLITKNEVRAAALHLLQLPRHGVMWDIGAGSGSVGIESARLCPGVLVYSVERVAEELENIRKNREKFAVTNLKVIPGEAPGNLAHLPQPDRVFIGGSGGQLDNIIAESATSLLPGGRIIVSAVIDKTREMAPQLLHKHGLKVRLHRIHVERTDYPENDSVNFNPITLIVGDKAP